MKFAAHIALVKAFWRRNIDNISIDCITKFIPHMGWITLSRSAIESDRWWIYYGDGDNFKNKEALHKDKTLERALDLFNNMGTFNIRNIPLIS